MPKTNAMGQVILRPYCPPLTDQTKVEVQYVDSDGNVIATSELAHMPERT